MNTHVESLGEVKGKVNFQISCDVLSSGLVAETFPYLDSSE